MAKRPTKKTPIDPELLQARLRRLALWGLLADFDRIANEEWLEWVIEVEQAERARCSLQRRIKYARLGNFRSMADFNWSWPRKIDRELLTELFTVTFVEEGVNVILLGPNGVGKTTVAKNLAHEAVVRGHTVRFTTAGDMLNDLAAQDSDQSFARRLRRYCWPKPLCIDEVGYLSYDARYADLLFEVVTRRYNDRRAHRRTSMERYVGLDAHSQTCTFAVLSEQGKQLETQAVETNGQSLVEFLKLVPGRRHLCLEEGTSSQWLYEILSPYTHSIAVVRGEKKLGNKSDERDIVVRGRRARRGDADGLVGQRDLRGAGVRDQRARRSATWSGPTG